MQSLGQGDEATIGNANRIAAGKEGDGACLPIPK